METSFMAKHGTVHKMPQFKGKKPAPGSTPAAPMNDLPAPGASKAGGAGGSGVRSHATRQDTGSKKLKH
jgi:hypothetical protein